LAESWGRGGRRKVQGRRKKVRGHASRNCWVPFNTNTNQSNSTANITSPIHAPVLEARWRIIYLYIYTYTCRQLLHKLGVNTFTQTRGATILRKLGDDTSKHTGGGQFYANWSPEVIYIYIYTLAYRSHVCFMCVSCVFHLCCLKCSSVVRLLANQIVCVYVRRRIIMSLGGFGTTSLTVSSAFAEACKSDKVYVVAAFF
jgi:hypothetical protein